MIAIRILVRKCWYEIVQFSEYFMKTLGFVLRYTSQKFSHEMLLNHRIKVKSNSKEDNNEFSNLLANKVYLHNTSLKLLF